MDNNAMLEQSKYRKQNFIDVYEGRIPKCIPCAGGVDGAAALEYACKNLLLDQYNAEIMIEAMDNVYGLFETDTEVGFSGR